MAGGLRISERRQFGLPGGELLFHFVLGDPVRLFDLSGQLIALAGDDIELVVRELAPLLLDAALDLLPVAFDSIPVHLKFPAGE